ncbi:MAG: mechanosensitive ion channel family protein [Acidobacteria bacterium]|nr:mechanosensitive ion channel family protein [Acidobacteriota bacterium]MBV9071112.1 mechanosensitive ion channel family protein [Acidobacteriota bacterium]
MAPRRKILSYFIPLILSAMFFGAFFAFDYFRKKPLILGMTGEVRDTVSKSLHFLGWIALIIFVVRVVDAFIFDVVISRRRNVVAPQLLRQIVAIVLYGVLFAFALNAVLSVNVTPALTGGAVVAAVVGLALQETLGNLFSGIAVHMEGAFGVGDVLHSGDYVGVVESVSWRATRMRGFNNQTLVLPNSVIARERLEVFPHGNLNARVLQLGIDYNVAPATVIEIVSQAAAHVDGVARELPCFARVGAFADSSVIYEIKYHTRDYAKRDRIDADIRKAVWYALHRNKISFATPVRAFQTYTPPESRHEVAPDEVLSRLREVDILSPLSEESRQTIAAGTRVHFYSKGETILRHAAAGDSMFVVHSGTASVRLPDDSDQGWHEVAQLGSGTVFGEMALLTGETRTADVVALTDVTALEIGKDALQPILSDHPNLVEAMTAKVIQRKGHLDAIRSGEPEEEEQTIVSRVRAWFGL